MDYDLNFLEFVEGYVAGRHRTGSANFEGIVQRERKRVVEA